MNHGLKYYANVATAPVFTFRSEMGYTDLEKRQLFLRSYQFSRKQSGSERIKKSLFRVRRVIWAGLRSARKLRKIIWRKLKNGLLLLTGRRRRRRLFRNYGGNLYLGGSANNYWRYCLC